MDRIMDIDVNKHSSIRIGDIYIDPFKISEKNRKAKYIFITHSHFDHLSFEDIDKIVNDKTVFVGTDDVICEINKRYKNFTVVVEVNGNYDFGDISFSTFPSYNIVKKFHPFSNGWVGYVIVTNGISYAILGDTDFTDEVKNIKCDVLFVPIGGTYTMNAREASELTNIIKPNLVIPVHYNDIVGNKDDEKEFLSNLADIKYQIYLRCIDRIGMIIWLNLEVNMKK